MGQKEAFPDNVSHVIPAFPLVPVAASLLLSSSPSLSLAILFQSSCCRGPLWNPLMTARLSRSVLVRSAAVLTLHMMLTLERWITSDEIALYDRQIRLWGVKAQEK